MCISRHEHLFITFALLLQLIEECTKSFRYLANAVASEEFEVEQHLVVARAAAMNLLSDVTKTTGEKKLHLGVNIFDTFLDDERAVGGRLIDAAQLGQ
jgi:hypothetical protein